MRYPLVIAALLVGFSMTAQAELAEDNAITASIVFYSHSYAIERIQNWCATIHPDSTASIQQARDEWDASHQPFWDVVPGLLKSRLSKDERMSIAVRARLDNDEIEAKLTNATRAEQIHWCKNAPAKITSPEMSLMNRPDLLQAITTYRAE